MSLSFQRPPFDPAGRVVARRTITLGKVYQHGEDIPESEGLTPRQIGMFWEQGLIDTVPREVSDAELERLTVPSRQKQPQPQRR